MELKPGSALGSSCTRTLSGRLNSDLSCSGTGSPLIPTVVPKLSIGCSDPWVGGAAANLTPRGPTPRALVSAVCAHQFGTEGSRRACLPDAPSETPGLEDGSHKAISGLSAAALGEFMRLPGESLDAAQRRGGERGSCSPPGRPPRQCPPGAPRPIHVQLLIYCGSFLTPRSSSLGRKGKFADRPVPHDHFVRHRVDERLAGSCIDVCDQGQPQRGQPGGEQRHWNDRDAAALEGGGARSMVTYCSTSGPLCL